MYRNSLAAAALAATIATLAGVTAPATAAAGGNAQVRVSLEHRIDRQVNASVHALARIEAQQLGSLEADNRAEVRGSIDADVAALVELRADADSDATVAELRATLSSVQEYRASVYAKAVAILNAAERLEANVQVMLANTVSATLTAVLEDVSAQLDVTVEGALELDATSTGSDVSEVRSDYAAAAHAYAQARARAHAG